MDLARVQQTIFPVKLQIVKEQCGIIETLYKDDVKVMASIMPYCSFNTSEHCGCTIFVRRVNRETLQHGFYNLKCLIIASLWQACIVICKVHVYTQPCEGFIRVVQP